MNNNDKSDALHEGIQVHLKRIQGLGTGHGVWYSIPERDDSVCKEVAPYGCCPTVLVVIFGPETLSHDIVSCSQGRGGTFCSAVRGASWDELVVNFF